MTAYAADADAALLAKLKVALQSISANDLQVLAECMAELKCPELQGRTLIRQGRNIQSQTNKGWPDAYVETAGNRVFGVEATRQISWEAHLAEDLAKASDPVRPTLSGYFFLGGYPPKEPTAEDLKKWSKEFQDLCIEPQAVTILVGKHLAMELARPIYAGLRFSILRMSHAPRVFGLLVPGLLADSNLGEYQPTVEDFTSDLVRASPSVLASVEAQLDARKYARVFGYGAAGKTTLAQIVARRRLPRPTYYLDMSKLDEQDAADIGVDLVEWAADGVLFVLDNVHQNSQGSAEAHRTWESYAKPRNAHLLQLGRFTSAGRSGKPESLVLRAGEDEMRAVVERLLVRHGLASSNLPKKVLESWQDLFGGASERGVDLIAFSAAVHGRLEAISRGSFRLTPADAVIAVRARYLDKLEDRERKNLFVLALVAQYEVTLGATAFPYPSVGLQMCRTSLGIVSEIRRGVHDARTEYSLVHPALGALILEGQAPTDDHQLALIELLSKTPILGLRLLHRMKEPLNSKVFGNVVDSLTSGEWVKSCSVLAELVAVLRWTRLKKICIPIGENLPRLGHEKIDHALCGNGYLRRLLNGTRSILTKRDFIEQVSQLNLQRTLQWVLSTEMQITLETDLACTPAHDVCQFLELHPCPGEVLARIGLDRWNEAQHAIPPQPMTIGLAAFKALAHHGCSEFSVMPALKILRTDDLQNIAEGAHIGHLSHVIRVSRAGTPEVMAFLLRIAQLEGGFDRFCERASIRHLCGALLSIANYWPQDALELVRPSLHRKVQGWLEDASKFPEDVVCMLGAYSLSAAEKLSIPTRLLTHLETFDLFQSNMFHGYPNRVGTYEIQMWLGIRYLSLQGVNVEIPRKRGATFFARLVNATPPSENARRYQMALRDWMHINCKCEINEKNRIAN